MYQLRELERKDLSVINQWRNNPDLIASLGAPFRFINEEIDESWFDEYLKNREKCVRCAITKKGNDNIIGLVSLVSIDFLNQSAEFHIMIGNKENQGKGIGSYAVQAMLQHAFLNMNLHRVELSVLESNKKAQCLYEKAGFTKEGVKRKAKYKNGKYVDLLLYALLREEWRRGQI